MSHHTVAVQRDDLVGRGQIAHVSETTDTLGRVQPRAKQKPKPKAAYVSTEAVKMAERIQARAIRREGELFKQIAPAKGGDRRSDQATAGDSLMSRKAAADAAGISPRQMFTAIRVANLDPDDFEAAVLPVEVLPAARIPA